MKPTGIFVFYSVLTFAMLLMLSGCTYSDCGHQYNYHANWHQTNADKPLDTIRLAVSRSPMDVKELGAESAVYPPGEIQVKIGSGLTWGHAAFFGIPLGDTGVPVPPPVDSVTLYIEKENVWRKTVLKLTAESQKICERGWRNIELGNITDLFEKGSPP